MLPAILPFHRYVYLGARDLNEECLASAGLVYQFLMSLVFLFGIDKQCKRMQKEPIIEMFGSPNPRKAFVICQVRSPLTQITLTTVPLTGRLDLYVWDPRKIKVGKRKVGSAIQLIKQHFSLGKEPVLETPST